MDFKTRKIRQEPKPPKPIFNNLPKLAQLKEFKEKADINLPYITIGGSIALLVVLVFGIYTFVQSLDFSAIVFSFGKTLQTDSNSRTNFLLAGIGGEGHEGANLTDTLIVASIDYKHNLVTMLSIPRDLYVTSKQLGSQKINSIYHFAKGKLGEQEGMNYLKELVEEITGLQIQYYVRINFQGFEQIVDSINGVEVYVENAIYDPYYPKGDTFHYETFKIDQGLQHLDGETALKYARSRKTTSDFDRARRQQQLLFAMKEKALSLQILTNPGKIKALYDSVADSLDTNLTLTEIIELAKLSKDFNKDDVIPLVINDNPSSCGGIVYTPSRDYFGGTSVLLPVGKNYEYVHLFTDKVLNNLGSLAKKEEIQILNGTKRPGLALSTMDILSRFCMNTVYYGNTTEKNLEKTTIFFKPDKDGDPPKTLELVKYFVPGQTVAGIPDEYLSTEKRQNSSIVIELGDDFLETRLDDPFRSLKFTAPINPENTNQTTTETQETNN
jgi:polyisoprenyl-teichoic acid--peptidoglycan teichoic acid transferase